MTRLELQSPYIPSRWELRGSGLCLLFMFMFCSYGEHLDIDPGTQSSLGAPKGNDATSGYLQSAFPSQELECEVLLSAFTLQLLPTALSPEQGSLRGHLPLGV